MSNAGARRAPFDEQARDRDAVRVALVTPWQGPAGMFGLSCRMCSELAVSEINLDGGLLGRPVELHHVDGGADPGAVARDVQGLVRTCEVDAVVGWHISAVRRRLAPRIAAQVPYVYTALYEGGERTPGVLLTGETPANQLGPALEWMRSELGVRRWAIVGDDYVWPRASAAEAARWGRAHGVPIVDEVYVPLGTRDFGPALRTLSQSSADGVLMLLVGEDAVHFNRAFAAAGLDFSGRPDCRRDGRDDAARVGRLRDPVALLGRRLLRGPRDRRRPRVHRAVRRAVGMAAPVPSSLGESCYEGMNLYAQLVRDAGTTRRQDVLAASEEVHFGGARGEMTLRRSHVVQDVYIARAQDVHFEVIARLSSGIREA